MVQIYELVDPFTREVRYIGKAVHAGKRLKGHLRDSRRRNTPVYCWIRSLASKGAAPTMNVIETVSDENWEIRERFHIAEARIRGIRLLNVADGGDEPFCSTAIRAMNGKANATAIHSDPARKRMWELKQKLGLALKQGFVNESTKAKLRAAALRHPELLGQFAAI